ncbi:MAG TPA: OmpA family protein, partial [Chitinophagaceae bacterium]|nr:OmpA family protein [Chitinophagaceae bacterium]
ENICTEYKINCSPKGWISTSDAFDNFYKIPGIAHSGQHCVAIAAGSSKKQFGRTYIRTQLLCQLRRGYKYRLEFYLKSKHDILDSVGICVTAYDFLFEKRVLHSIVADAYVKGALVHPQKADTNWQKISIDYTASGEEMYLTLGNFSKCDITGPTGIPLENSFLVFFDDISFTPDDPNEKICDNWLHEKDEIYSFSARHQLLDVYIKRHLNDPPERPRITKTLIQTVDTITLPDVLFEVGRSEVTSKSFHILDSLFSLLKDRQIDSLVVEGYTDNSGTAVHNQELSRDRALSTARYIREKLSLNKQLVISRGLGSEKPVADNATSTGRQLNRRVEIFIYIRK